MRAMRRIVLIGLAILSLCGCGGAASVPVAEPVAAADDGCGPRATRVAGACWSAHGTRWRVTTEASAGVDELELELMAAGRVRSNDHPAASPAMDEWFLERSVLRVFLADRFVEYRATVTNGTVLVGEAINARGQRWPWSAVRVFGEPTCERDEARIEGACMTVAGTRWRVEGQGELIELLAEGVVATGPEDARDRWTQEGERVRFTTGAGAHQFEATLEGDGALRGTRDDGAAFTASRVESIPPALR
jgi:hypothetical protein